MHIRIKSIFTTIILMTLPAMLFAAETTTGEAPGDKEISSFNPVLTGLVSLVIVLLAAIGIVANVLRQLAYVYRNKMRSERAAARQANITGIVLLLVCMAPSLHSFAADAAPQAATAPAFINGIPETAFYALISIIGLEILVLLSMIMNIRMLVRLLTAKPETEKIAKAIIRRSFWDRFNRSVEIEKEKDILLDHDYDGIRELDNSLPPWWKYGFYLTILVAVIYIWYYHFGSGPGSIAEYTAEVEKGKQEVAAYLAASANNVDENTVQLITDKSQLTGAEGIFQSTCAACHAKDGGGGIGPNLTDDYWLHGGSIQDVFKSIKYGWQDKGMKSWKEDFPPKQIAELASYIKSLHGSRPAVSKPPQGDLYKDMAIADSTATQESSQVSGILK